MGLVESSCLKSGYQMCQETTSNFSFSDIITIQEANDSLLFFTRCSFWPTILETVFFRIIILVQPKLLNRVRPCLDSPTRPQLWWQMGRPGMAGDKQKMLAQPEIHGLWIRQDGIRFIPGMSVPRRWSFCDLKQLSSRSLKGAKDFCCGGMEVAWDNSRKARAERG